MYFCRTAPHRSTATLLACRSRISLLADTGSHDVALLADTGSHDIEQRSNIKVVSLDGLWRDTDYHGATVLESVEFSYSSSAAFV